MTRLTHRILLGVTPVCVGVIGIALWAQMPGGRGGTPAQAPVAPTTEEYLLMGDATRGAGEAKIAVDPTNPKNIVAISMGNLQVLPGYKPPVTAGMTDKYHEVDRSTIPWLAVTHDGGTTWKVGELPILSGKNTRCPDPFVGVTKDGVFLAGCEPRETTGEFYGGSAVMISPDKGDTWGKPAEIISSYSQARFAPGLKPRIGGNSPWDGPDIYLDDATGTIYAKATGGQTDIDTGTPGKYRSESYLTASADGGKSFGTIYSFDSLEYPQSSSGAIAAGHGVVAVMYAARTVPASERATCPCQVLGISRDQGKTFSYHVMKNVTPPLQSGMPSPEGPSGSSVSDLKIDPNKAGRMVFLKYTPTPKPQYEVAESDDWGQTWGSLHACGHDARGCPLHQAAVGILPVRKVLG